MTASAAAAGSGEFHVYKHGRRKEYERIRKMEQNTRDVSAFWFCPFTGVDG